jgi:hypothetical protein
MPPAPAVTVEPLPAVVVVKPDAGPGGTSEQAPAKQQSEIAAKAKQAFSAVKTHTSRSRWFRTELGLSDEPKDPTPLYGESSA